MKLLVGYQRGFISLPMWWDDVVSSRGPFTSQDADVVLLDEPTGHLDVACRAKPWTPEPKHLKEEGKLMKADERCIVFHPGKLVPWRFLMFLDLADTLQCSFHVDV